MDNLGYTGFIIQKTAQKHSLRKDNSNFNEFKNKNIVMYIHKKVSNNKERLGGVKQSAAALASGVNFVVMNQNLVGIDRPQQKINVQKEDEEFDKETAHIMKKIKDQSFQDDFHVETVGGEDPKKNYVNRKNRENADKKLAVMLNQAIDEKEMLSLFSDYRRTQLKEKINDIKQRKMDFSKIQQKIQNSKKNEVEDQDQVDFFMTEITKPQAVRPQGFTIGQILKIEENQIQYKSKKIEEEEREQRRQGRLAMEQLNDLIQDEEERQKKGIIKIYKQTKLDNMDGDAAKHKYKMINFKKKQEIQEKLFQDMANQEKLAYQDALKDKDFNNPDKFFREKKSFDGPKKSVNVYKRLTKTTSAPTQQLINALKISQIKEEQEKRYNLGVKNKTFTDVMDAYDNMKPKQEAKHKRQVSSTLYGRSNATTRPNSSRQLHSSVGKHTEGAHTHRPQSALTNQTARSHLYYNNQNIQENHSSKHTLARPQSAASPFPKEFIDWNIEDLKKKVIEYSQAHQYSKDQTKIQQILDKKQFVQQFNNLINECKSIHNDNQKDERKIKGKLRVMENDIQDELEQIEKTDFEKPPIQQQNQIQQAKGDKFSEFKRERNFKRKLIGFLIDKVEKKSDLISKYNNKKWTEELLSQITQASD
ncbi:hypothetical protein ABPG74_008640 [Tetrahymena malaccensis]